MEKVPCVNCYKELTDTVVCPTCQKHWPGTQMQLNALIAAYEIVTFRLPNMPKEKYK